MSNFQANHRSYQQEEIQEILQIAIARQASGSELSHAQLVEIATELGISAEELQLAETEWQSRKVEQKQREEYAAYLRQKIRRALGRYIIVNGCLVAVNLVSAGTISWAWYVISIWGLSLGVSTWNAHNSESDRYDEGFSKWQRRQQMRQTVNHLWQKVNKFLES